MSQYIGAIAFAKGLDRTLVLPPFVKYRFMAAGSVSCVLCNMCTTQVYVLLEYITGSPLHVVQYRKEYHSQTTLT